jgi:hypothetical protein
MKINVVAVLLFAGGFVLIYGAVRNVNPKDVVVSAFTGKNPADLPQWGGADAPLTLEDPPPEGEKFDAPGPLGTPPPGGGGHFAGDRPRRNPPRNNGGGVSV